MFGQGFDSPQLHQRFEPRLKANQKTGSTAQVPLPFSLARPLPRSPLRSADGHRNRDAIVPRYLHISAFPIGNRYSVADSVRSLQLPSAPPRNGSRFTCRLPFFFAWLRCGECTPVACLRQADRLHARAPRYSRIVASPNLGARCKATPLSSTNASSRRSRGSIQKHLAVPYRRSLFRPRFARPYGLKRTKKQGVRHKCHSLFLWLAPCLALRSVPLMGTEIVTRLFLDISISRHPLSAIAIPSRTLSAPYNSPQLHQRFEQTLARLDTKASRRTLSSLAIPSSLRSSLRLKRLLIA